MSVNLCASEGGRVVERLGEVDDVVEVGSALYRLDTDAKAGTHKKSCGARFWSAARLSNNLKIVDAPRGIP